MCSTCCADALRHRAPVFLRVNRLRADLATARDALARDGIEVTLSGRRLRQSRAVRDGLVELQDAASQAVAETLGLRDGMRVLDFCAGLEKAGRFALVLCDAPCSGSGAWRRSPDAKWSLTPQGLSELAGTQLTILKDAARFLTRDATLAYATCSLLKEGDEDVIMRRFKTIQSKVTVECSAGIPMTGLTAFSVRSSG